MKSQLKITKTALSVKCRKEIIRLCREHDVVADTQLFLNQVDEACSWHSGLASKGHFIETPRKQIRKQVKALQCALRRMNSDVIDLLCDTPYLSNDDPRIDLNKAKGLFMARCKRFLDNDAPMPKSRPTDWNRYTFIQDLQSLFEHTLHEQPTEKEKGLFNLTVRAILEDITDSKVSSQRELISRILYPGRKYLRQHPVSK